MNKALLRSGGAALVAISLLWLTVYPASAMKPFHDEFVAKYVRPDSTDAKEKAFAKAVETAKCNVCHEEKTKKERNVYGRALNNFLNDDDGEDTAKIREALDKVAQLKSSPNDSNSPTFGELIKAGKLPGGAPKSDATKPRN